MSVENTVTTLEAHVVSALTAIRGGIDKARAGIDAARKLTDEMSGTILGQLFRQFAGTSTIADAVVDTVDAIDNFVDAIDDAVDAADQAGQAPPVALPQVAVGPGATTQVTDASGVTTQKPVTSVQIVAAQDKSGRRNYVLSPVISGKLSAATFRTVALAQQTVGQAFPVPKAA
jgi:hypothetical protein